MAAFLIKRMARNAVARRAPTFYDGRIAHTTASVPPLQLSGGRLSERVVNIAQSVATFYNDEYADHVNDIAEGRLTFYGKEVDFGGVENIDWQWKIEDETDFHLWRQKLAHMGFLCPMLMSARDNHRKAAAGIIESYRRNSSFKAPDCFSSYWFPYSVSHRILAILSGYVLAIQERDIPSDFRRLIESFLRENVGFLLANVEHELRNNHVERNLTALCLYFSCVDRPPARRARYLDREVQRIMRACVLSDGLSIERSAMYQGFTVMALDVFSKTTFLSEQTRSIASDLHAKATRAWHFMSHPDGQIALFNDSWIGEVPEPRKVSDPPAFAPVEVLPHAGYARLQAGPVFALMDAGPIGPRWHPGHGHADFLSLEIDVATERFIVDPGTYQYSTGPRRTFERSAASHNGPVWKGVEPVEYIGCFRVGRMNEAAFVTTDTLPSAKWRGVKGRLALRNNSAVERSVELLADGLKVVDDWSGCASAAQVRLTVPAKWTLGSQDSTNARFTCAGSGVELIVLHGVIAGLERSHWSSHYLHSQSATTVILMPKFEGPDRRRLVWEVRALTD